MLDAYEAPGTPDCRLRWASALCAFPSAWASAAGQQMARIITVRTGEAGDGWLCPMSPYPHDR